MTTTNIYQIHSETPSADKAEIAARIEGLTPRIIAYSGFIFSPELDREDIQQEMVKAILEQARKDPDFIHQKDSYLLKLATWKAQAAAARTRVYDSRIKFHLEDDLGDLEDLDEKPRWSHIETVAYLSDCFDPDETDPALVIERTETLKEIMDALSSLSPDNITVVRMIYLGYSQKEIAEKMGVSPAAITQRKNTIAREIKHRTWVSNRRGFKKDQVRFTTCEQVKSIREQYRTSGKSMALIGKKYGMSQYRIWEIVAKNGKSHRTCPPPIHGKKSKEITV